MRVLLCLDRRTDGGTNSWIDYTDPARAAQFIGGEVETFATAQPQGLREELPEGGQCGVYGNCAFHFGDQVCAQLKLTQIHTSVQEKYGVRFTVTTP